jgi:DNA-binding beta-propeller fold protein YncE
VEAVIPEGVTRQPLRRQARGLGGTLAALVLASGIVACGGVSLPHRQPSTSVPTPTSIIPGPAGLRSGTGPGANGLLWVLAGTGGVRTLQLIDVVSRADRTAVPVPNSAVAVAQSPAGLVGLGLATATAGALEILNGATGAVLATVPVVAPVRAVASAQNGTAFYVLTRGSASASVTTVDIATRTAGFVAPAPLGAVAVVPAPEGSAVWVLRSNGVLAEVGVPGGEVTTQFSAGGSGRALAISPDGSMLYVLKGSGKVRNVAVVDLATESVMRVIPAPADAVGLALSPGGTTLYDFVGTAAAGTIQAFRVTS